MFRRYEGRKAVMNAVEKALHALSVAGAGGAPLVIQFMKGMAFAAGSWTMANWLKKRKGKGQTRQRPAPKQKHKK